METALASVELIAKNALPKGIERLRITSRDDWHAMRAKDVTASAISALVGAHDYETEYGLWAIKSGKVLPDQEETAAMERGTLLEPVAVELLKKRYPDWKFLYPVAAYYRDPEFRIGATPDLFAVRPDRPGFGNIQIKSVDGGIFRTKWRADGENVDPPIGAVIQSNAESSLTGASWSAVASLVVGFGLDLHLVEFEIHAKIMAKLRAASLKLWTRVEDNDPPPADFARDAATIAALYPEADEGKTIDLRGSNRARDLVETREVLKRDEALGTAAVKARKVVDAEILSMLGDAAYGDLGDGRIISAKTIKRRGYEVAPSSYRTVSVKGETQNARRSHAAAEGSQPAGAWDKPF